MGKVNEYSKNIRIGNIFINFLLKKITHFLITICLVTIFFPLILCF